MGLWAQRKTQGKVQKVQLTNFLFMLIVRIGKLQKDRAEKWPEVSLPGFAAMSCLRFYYIWFS
uniref:Macaca fascicularis brain cDNA clone: QtrA-17991, similar to human mitogen-activated protein kinase 9 (MAPK9), transcriptvariant 3, mRNA, RefSeq: NM_139069.1 n=1 Tax=Macaca fascicularis TaxID=9541 RepID=I7GNV0_MACFA|nr:unnamed protein product [Macaca fascicularis]